MSPPRRSHLFILTRHQESGILTHQSLSRCGLEDTDISSGVKTTPLSQNMNTQDSTQVPEVLFVPVPSVTNDQASLPKAVPAITTLVSNPSVLNEHAVHQSANALKLDPKSIPLHNDLAYDSLQQFERACSTMPHTNDIRL